MTTDPYQSALDSGQVTWLRGIPKRVEALGMYGLDDAVSALVVALLTGGHVLLEGNPGLGKTALVRALSEALGLGASSVGRIQFTPDLMPSDITGTLMPSEDGSGRLEFSKGPIFCRLLLADEINRATAKTQSAMLEAMAEYQVTVLGKTYPLRHWAEAGRQPYRTPFMVMATQNPIDQDGTHSLPEAQSDRFMFKLQMHPPGTDVLAQIIGKSLTPERPPASGQGAVEDLVQSREAMARLHEISTDVLSLPLRPDVATHVANIVQATNLNFAELRDLPASRVKKLRELVETRITYPLGPRAAIALARAAQGWAVVRLVPPGDAGRQAGLHAQQALAETVVAVLRHRLRITHDYSALASPQAEAAALDTFIRDLAIACAPEAQRGGNYPADFAAFAEGAQKTIRL